MLYLFEHEDFLAAVFDCKKKSSWPEGRCGCSEAGFGARLEGGLFGGWFGEVGSNSTVLCVHSATKDDTDMSLS